jgi:hypothetical protein
MKSGHQSGYNGHKEYKDHDKGVPRIPFDNGGLIEQPEKERVKNYVGDNLK